VEDTASLVVKSRQGAIGTLVSSWAAGSPAATIDVIGEWGRLHFDYGRGDELLLEVRGTREILSVPRSNGFQEQIAHFLKVIQGQESPICTGADGLRSLEVIFDCYGE